MCGICGTVGLADERAMRHATRLLAHRGPDGEGVRCFPSFEGSVPAALGHRRLSIIDPTPRGAQPMPYGDGRYWITYNGELYNFRELRAGLEKEGLRFRTETDTEVLLAMYARYGEEMLLHLNGIFAFGIWDCERQSLFLARDRLGVKPLYWSMLKDAFHFASEIKALLPFLPRPSIRLEAVADYLTFLWVPDPETLLDGVFKLPAGHCASYAGGRLAIRKYWDMSFGCEQRSEREWAEMVGQEVSSAVRRQEVADVPLGAFLSGGIDSSAIVAELAREGRRPSTYTVGFAAEDLAHDVVPDDLRYSRVVAERFDVDYHEQTLEPEIVDLLPKLVWHMDDPIADPATLTTYLICDAARERLTVILSGMGGDEVFAGYPRHLAARLGLFADVLPSSVRRGMRSLLEGHLGLGAPGRLRGPRRNLLKLMRGIDLPADDRYLTYCSYYRPDELASAFAPDARVELARHDPFRHHREHLARVSGEHWLNRILYLDMKTFLPCLNLAYTDKMSMAASTEVRVPLLDDRLVELAARIPADLKLRRATRKYVLKRSMESRLPREVVWRPKAGFGAPIRSWLTNELRPMVADLCSAERLASRGLFDPGWVHGMIDDFHMAREDNALRIWALLTLELWQQEFLDGSGNSAQAVPVTA